MVCLLYIYVYTRISIGVFASYGILDDGSG